MVSSVAILQMHFAAALPAQTLLRLRVQFHAA